VSFIDARGIPHEAEVETDVCIIGAGAAGITIASELVGMRQRVILLESGGQTPDQDTQALYVGENTGHSYYPLATVRLRYFGGTTNHWTGACRPLDPLDFRHRDWVPHSGWPVSDAQLVPYYRRAHSVCDLGPADYDPASWESEAARALTLDPATLQTVMYRLSPPTRFAQKFAPVLEQESNVATYLHGNAVGLRMSDSESRISAIEVACLPGTRFRIKAGVFILATGGIENPRFLLHCLENGALRLDPASHYWVGRCFMEHLSVTGGVFLPADRNWSAALYHGGHSDTGHFGYAVLAPSVDAMHRERILNAKIHLTPTSVREGLRSIAPGLVGAVTATQTGRLFEDLGEHIRGIISELDEITVYSYEQMFRSHAARGAYYLNYHLENAPDPESRVTLGASRDSLGMKQAQLHWRFGELELRTLRRLNELLGAEAGASGTGRVWEAPSDDRADWPPGVRGAWHQMGTTRMSARPEDGVVDGDCRVHGVDNFYIAGSSVFPTSGHANPTLSIVALAIRLADRVKESSS
jgi:choline dehydrogenase-like flavoprotein